MVASVIVGMMLGIFTVLIQRMMNKGVTDSDEILNETGLSVYASIPYSTMQNKIARRISKKGNQQSGVNLLAYEERGE